MKYISLASVLSLLLSCGGTSEPPPQYPQRLSVEEHEERAEYHEQEANEALSKVKPASEIQSSRCTAPGSTLESGGERMPIMSPCWTVSEENAAFERLAKQQQRAAQKHREWASALLKLESSACKTLSERERQVSPFEHPQDELLVEPYTENGKIRGVRVVFGNVPNLTKDWLFTSVACHQARAAKVGYAKDWMAHCPLALPDTAASISESDGSLSIVLRSTNEIVASEILGRTLRLKEMVAQKPSSGGPVPRTPDIYVPDEAPPPKRR